MIFFINVFIQKNRDQKNKKKKRKASSRVTSLDRPRGPIRALKNKKLKNRRQCQFNKIISNKSKIGQNSVFLGDQCQFIDFVSVKDIANGCQDGSQMRIQTAK